MFNPGGGCRDDGAVDAFYLPPQESATTEALATAAGGRGLQVLRYRDATDLSGGKAYAYGGPRFMDRLSRQVDLVTLEPVDDWLPSLPWRLRRRDIRLMPLSEASTTMGRAFVKTPREKDFEAGIYTGPELPTSGVDDPMVLVSDIVTFTREYRILALDGQVHTGSRYLTGGRLDARPLDHDADRSVVLGFAQALLSETAGTLPSAVTVDIGWAVNADTGDQGWAVVEANMAWFSNIYDCNPERALDVVVRGAGPADAVSSRDRAFVTPTISRDTP